MTIEAWFALPFSNAYIFAQVMQDPKLCKKMLEVLLNIEIERIEYIETEKTIAVGFKSKGVRLDVYVKGDSTVYNIELQAIDTYELPERSRFYQGITDVDMLLKGEKYAAIKPSYVIFICMEDIFKQGMYKYSFENTCQEVDGLKLNDKAYKIFFNPHGTKGEISDEAKAIMNFLRGMKSDTPFIQEIEAKMSEIKQSEYRRLEYMNALFQERNSRLQGIEIGIGRGIGQEKLNIAKACLADGLDVSTVMRVTGLNENTIKNLDTKIIS